MRIEGFNEWREQEQQKIEDQLLEFIYGSEIHSMTPDEVYNYLFCVHSSLMAMTHTPLVVLEAASGYVAVDAETGECFNITARTDEETRDEYHYALQVYNSATEAHEKCIEDITNIQKRETAEAARRAKANKQWRADHPDFPF